MTAGIRVDTVQIGEMTFGILESGPADGPLVLCLHGFPDTPWTWRHLLADLARAGLRGVAPYLRGYGPSSPSPDGRYPLAVLADDVVRLHERLGGGPDAALVGHDWGAAIAYGAGALAPDRFSRLVGLAVPPPVAFVQGLGDFDQLRRSFYFFFFQTPLAEAVLEADDMAFVERLWREWSPGYDPREDLVHVRAALAAPGRLSAALGYYRAMFDPAAVPAELAPAASAVLGPVPQPTLYLHGRRDGCVGAEVVERPDVAATIQALLPAGSRVATLEDAGHFLHLERPADVGRRILGWVTGNDVTSDA